MDIRKIKPIFLVLFITVKIIPIINIVNKSPIEEIIIINISIVGFPPSWKKKSEIKLSMLFVALTVTKKDKIINITINNTNFLLFGINLFYPFSLSAISVI